MEAATAPNAIKPITRVLMFPPLSAPAIETSVARQASSGDRRHIGRGSIMSSKGALEKLSQKRGVLSRENARPHQRLACHGTLDIIEPTSGRTTMPTSGSSRRAFIKTVGLAAAATCGGAAAAKAQDYKPQEQKKL